MGRLEWRATGGDMGINDGLIAPRAIDAQDDHLRITWSDDDVRDAVEDM